VFEPGMHVGEFFIIELGKEKRNSKMPEGVAGFFRRSREKEKSAIHSGS